MTDLFPSDPADPPAVVLSARQELQALKRIVRAFQALQGDRAAIDRVLTFLRDRYDPPRARKGAGR